MHQRGTLKVVSGSEPEEQHIWARDKNAPHASVNAATILIK